MRLFAALLAFAFLVPSADAAVIATTKQKKLPVIDHAYVAEDRKTFGFDVVKAPTTEAYDVWARVTGDRGRVNEEIFVRSMKLRRIDKKLASAEFKGNAEEFIPFARPGTYVLTLLACPANLREPTEVACAHASTNLVKKSR